MTCAVLAMEVGPPGSPMQVESPNHRKLRRSRAGVVSVAAKAPPGAEQVCDEKTNVCEPLLTHRNVVMASKPGKYTALGEWRAVRRGRSQAAACVLAWWCPVYRWRELVVGAGMNRRTCRFDTDGQSKWVKLAPWSREGEPEVVVPRRGEYRCDAQGRTGPY
jgi:hypothetical protein